MATPLKPGTLLGRYRIIRPLGQGGMGVVYRAHDEKLRRDVALKILLHVGDEAARRHLRNEALSLSKLNHPNVATVHDYDTVHDTDFMVTELVDGVTLDQRPASAMSESEVIRIAKQVVEGLAAAHAGGLIHRDLKPANIAVNPDGLVKILDFGLARPSAAAAYAASTSTAPAKEIAGTLPYMAPEQLRGAPGDDRTDIYAFGATLYELLTGKLPHPVPTSMEMVGAILHRPVASPRALNPHVSPAMESVLLKCLDKDADLRYQSAKDLAADLRRVEKGVTASEPVIELAAGRSRGTRWWLTAALLALLAGMAVIGFFLWHRLPVGHIRSVVVLPLTNPSSDAEQAYLAAAMTEELTDSLSGLNSIRVISRATANRYRQTTLTIPQISRQLDVDAVISGSVTRLGDSITARLEIVDGATDRALWGKTYDRKASEIAELRRELVEEVARQMKLSLNADERQQITALPTQNQEAYDAYLRGQYALDTASKGKESAMQVVANAEEAIRLDPEFAEAYVLLAKGCGWMVFSWHAGTEWDEKAFVAVGRALALNPKLPEAYEWRGHLYFNRLHNFDLGKAITNYQRALALNPNSASVHHSMGSELTHLGLHDRAIEEFRTSLRLDPQMDGSKFRLGRALWQANRFDEALLQYESIDYKGFERAVVLGYLGRTQDGLDFLDRSANMNPNAGDADFLAARAFLYALQGKRLEIDKLAAASEKAGANDDHFHHAAFVLACSYAELGETPKAVKWLRFAADNGMPNYPLMRNNPSTRKLQGQPEYEKLMQELKPRFDAIVAEIQNN